MFSYLREVQLIVGGKKFTFPEQTIYFNINFGEETDSNDADIDIYNLSNETINLIKKEQPIILNAGYEGDVGNIFLGGVVEASTETQEVDRVTKITATDASEAWNKLEVVKTFKAGTRASQMLQAFIAMTGFDIGAFELPNDIEYLRARTFSGKLPSVIKQVAKDAGAKVHITKSKIYIRDPKAGDDVSFLFNNERGLIGTPEPFEDEDVSGYKVRALLNHRVTTDSMVQIESSTANGTYRVRKGSHKADEGTFYTEMEVVE